MYCPFCAEEIKDEAIVCRYCGRDLSILRPVLDRLRPMNERLAAIEAAEAAREDMETRLSALEAKLAELTAGGAPLATAAAPGFEALPPAEARPQGWSAWLGRLVLALVVPILALVLAHWLVVIVIDMKVWVIRVVSLLLPLLFGLYPILRSRRFMTLQTVLGLVIGVSSVILMSMVTGLVDDAPWWPQDGRDWRELIEYGLSIWLSYLTGAFINDKTMNRSSDRQAENAIGKMAQLLASITAPENETRAQMEKRIKAMTGTIGALVPLVTGVTSIYAGIHQLVG